MSSWLQRSRAPLQKLYLFHPSYTNVLLELRNSTDQIIAFSGKSSSPSSKEAQEDAGLLVPPGLHGCVVLGLVASLNTETLGWAFPSALHYSRAVRAEPPCLLRAVEGPSTQRGARVGVSDEA